jgi:hypothetical protein
MSKQANVVCALYDMINSQIDARLKWHSIDVDSIEDMIENHVKVLRDRDINDQIKNIISLAEGTTSNE